MENFEFEDMKHQLALLQKKLDKHVEIKDEQLKEAIKGGVNTIHAKDKKSYILCSVIFVIMPLYLWYAVNASLPVVLSCIALMGFNLYKAFGLSLSSYGLNENKMNLVETSEILGRYKKNQIKYVVYMLPITILWCGYMVYDMIVKNELTDSHFVGGIIICCIVGGVTGFLIGYNFFMKPVIKAVNETQERIAELQE